ncbi:hypothetical protein K1719_026851 [Acacia pycnantha]|nr:hypothetical protein K1719_026851 [Acacia pycnantha]
MVILSETKTENPRLFRSLEQFGFDGFALVPSVGRSGGLVAVWKKALIKVSVLREERQFFHFSCCLNGELPFYLTAVYAIPIPSFKQMLWSDLKNLAGSMVSPWVVLGDFNDIISSNDRTGGAGVNFSRIQLFNDRILSCNLSDMGFCGPAYTWKGPRNVGFSRLFERLDRALVNPSWLSTFSECFLQVLPRSKYSDHNPICLAFGTMNYANKYCC